MNRAAITFPILFSCLASAWAGSISMQTSISGSVKNDVYSLKIDVTNRGNEAAYNVQVKSDDSMAPAESPLQSILPVGETHSATLTQPLKKLLPGRYPFIARILYADANLYPFSAIAISFFVHQQDTDSRLIGQLSKIAIQSHGRLKLKIRNGDELPQNVHIRLALPQELTTDASSQDLVFSPHQEKTLTFPIKNFSALGGSTYSVFCIMEYESAGLHYTSVAPGTVVIAAPSVLGDDWIWKTLLGVGLVILLLINVRHYQKRK